MRRAYQVGRLATVLVGLALVVLGMPSLALCMGGRGQGNECTVTISHPQQGEEVGGQGAVEGHAANIPSQGYLWVLARKHGFHGWWPQGGGPADVDDGSWTVQVTYGTSQDQGPFDIVAVVVGSTENARLRRWVEDTGRTGSYPPIDLPRTLPTCPVVRLRVNKAHD